jgi:hypothetical protein
MSDVKEKQTNNSIGFEDEILLGIVSFAMDIIGGSWKFRIIIAIAIRNKRSTLKELKKIILK